MPLTANRLDLAHLLLQPVPLVEVDKLSLDELRSAAAHFGEELRKAEKLDAEGWQQRWEDLNDDFHSKLQGYAQDVAAGDLTPAEWRRAMENSIRSDYARAYQMGASVQEGERAYLNEDDHAAIGDKVSDQFDYLRGFYGDLRDEDLSEEYIRARADMYGDDIRSLYWRGRLSRANEVDAWYRANAGACQPCESDAAGSPYDPMDCPIPGEDCVGFSHCRCHVEFLTRSESDDEEKAVVPELLKYCAQPRRGDGGRFSGCDVGGGTGGGGGGGGGAKGGGKLLLTRKPGGGRSGAGATNFLGRSGKTYNATQAGEIGEHIAQHVTRPLIEKHFGGSYVRISHAAGAGAHGGAGSRTTPWDGRVGKNAIDIKTISASAKSQKVAIKSVEVARKIGDARKNGWTSNIIVQRIDHQQGRVDLYLLKGDTKAGYIPSKSWKSADAIHLGGKNVDVGAYFKVAA